VITSNKKIRNRDNKKKIKDYFGYASLNNPTMLIMYYLSYPLVLFFEKINIKPNHVTFLSVCFAFLSLVSLVYMRSISLFVITFFASQLLDYCDGTLARKTNQISKNVINPDKFSDLIKIFLTHLSLSIYFNDKLVWIIAFLSLFLFLLFVTIALEVEKKIEIKKRPKKIILLRKKILIINQIYSLPLIGPMISFAYRFCTTVQGQSILVFIISPFNYKVCLCVFAYFIFNILFNISRTVSRSFKI